MPEVLTKYPNIVMKVLESAGAKCGDGAPQQILKQCPSAQFCALPKGEICVYGTKDVSNMTQIHPSDLIVGTFLSLPIVIALLIALLLGILIGKRGIFFAKSKNLR